MKTDRFETFLDAILAIIITVLVLKLAQPSQASLSAIFALRTDYLTYFLSFLIIFNVWYHNHNLFQIVDEIDNRVIEIYAFFIFVLSLLPYFASWLGRDLYCLPAEICYGLIFVIINILYIYSIRAVFKSDRYNQKLREIDYNPVSLYLPLAVILIGFAISMMGFTPGIYISCLVSVACWMVLSKSKRKDVEMDSGRFEALVDAIVAIILTVIVLEISMVSTNTWQGLFDLKLEFIAYAISFIVCFSYWNINNNTFSFVNKINSQVIWSVAASLFFLSMIPYLTIFVSQNFTSLLAQSAYGIVFLIIMLLSPLRSYVLMKADPDNEALQRIAGNYAPIIINVLIVLIGFAIAFAFYPPAIIFSCLLAIAVVKIYMRLWFE